MPIGYKIAPYRKTGSATDDEVIASPGTGKWLEIISIDFTVSAAANVQFTQGADGSTTRIIDLLFSAAGGALKEYGPETPYVLPNATALNCTHSAGDVRAVVYYRIGGA